jgi:hypothetical protein
VLTRKLNEKLGISVGALILVAGVNILPQLLDGAILFSYAFLFNQGLEDCMIVAALASSTRLSLARLLVLFPADVSKIDDRPDLPRLTLQHHSLHFQPDMKAFSL